MPKTDEQLIAEAKAFTRARKARERHAKKRAHQLKMLQAVRAGDKVELDRLRTVNPLLNQTKRQLRGGRPTRDWYFGKSVSRTYVSDITLDAGEPFCGINYNEGYHRGQS